MPKTSNQSRNEIPRPSRLNVEQESYVNGGIEIAFAMNQGNFFSVPNPNNSDLADAVWRDVETEIESLDTSQENWWKSQELPVGKVKKIMKQEFFAQQQIELQKRLEEGEDVDLTATQPVRFMIASEACVLLTKASEIFARELAARSWKYAANSRRKTLQKPDLYAGMGETDMFDFLIDVCPRGINPMMDPNNATIVPPATYPNSATMPPPPVPTMMHSMVPQPSTQQSTEVVPPPDFTMDGFSVPLPTPIDTSARPPPVIHQHQLQQHFAAHPPGTE